jgi:hypothetical protein
MRALFFVVPVLAGVVGFVACSGSSLSPAGGTSAQQAATDAANAYCGQVAKCEPVVLASDYGSMAACVTARTQVTLNSLAAPGTGATPETSEACTAAYPTYSCADFINDVVPPACKPQVGTGATGAACFAAGQCQSAFCQIPKAALCGTCQPALASGSSCANSNCPTGLHCAATTSTCVTYGAAGAACTENSDCGYQLDCVGADAAKGTPGTCTAEVATAGATCDHAQKTGAGCDPTANLICGRDNKCDTYDTATTGQPCGYVANDGGTTYTYCTGGSRCLTSGTASTCTGPAAAGAACNTALDNLCADPATCTGSTVDGGVSGTCQVASATSCP